MIIAVIYASSLEKLRVELSFIYLFAFFTFFGHDQLPDSLMAQLVEHRTGNAEAMGSNIVRA